MGFSVLMDLTLGGRPGARFSIPDRFRAAARRLPAGGAPPARPGLPDRPGHLLRHARGHPLDVLPGQVLPFPEDAGRDPDQLGEAAAEGPERGTADREADLGDTEVA